MRMNKFLAVLLALLLVLTNVFAFAQEGEGFTEPAAPATVEETATEQQTQAPAAEEVTTEPVAEEDTEEAAEDAEEVGSETSEETEEAPVEGDAPAADPEASETAPDAAEMPVEDKSAEIPATEEEIPEIEVGDDEATDEDAGIATAAYELSENYYNAKHGFGYDVWTGCSVKGATVTVGGVTLTVDSSTAVKTQEAVNNGVVVSFDPGYYLAKWKIVCGHKYSCLTDRAGNAAKAYDVMDGATAASWKLTPSKADFGHSSKTGPYWLLMDIKEDPTKYPVTYNWGILEDQMTSATPADAEYLVNKLVLVEDASKAAKAEGVSLGYTFLGWTNSYEGYTGTPGKTFPMPQQAVTLTAIWEKIPTTSVTVTKEWSDADNQDGQRPAKVTVSLLAGGVTVEGSSVELSADNSWTHTWPDLPIDVEYTVAEAAVAGYTPEISGNATDGYTITNIHTPEKVDISGAKTWEDADDQDGIRPESITINLLADGVKVASKTVTEADGWAWSFTGMDEYAAGKKIAYSVEEVAVDGYTAVVEGFNVTNKHTPEVYEKITVTKVWDDAENQDGIRPASVTINLLADGKVVATQEANEGNKWTCTFTDLPKNAAGNPIVYTVTDEVKGYTAAVVGSAAEGFVLTNTHEPETIAEISVTKVWDDKDNQDGIRPNSITVSLLANGKAVDSKVVAVAADGSWSCIFENLPKYAAGKEIVYTVTDDVEGYEASCSGSVAEGLVLTNKHEVEKTSVSGSKVWDDAENQDGKRPGSITINLLANGVKVDSKTVTAESGWTWTFDNLDKFAGGAEIVYAFAEEKVEGYSTKIEGNVVTNSYTPGKVNVSVSKIWNDASNQDGIRPASITVVLLANGEKADEAVLNADGSWKHTFEGLDEYKAGQKIAYTVEELTVKGYDSEITGDAVNGYTITNTHEPEKAADMTGSKTWADSNNQDGIRPASVTINLLADGKVVAQAVANAENNWSWNFSGMPKYSEGKLIEYTITENAVDGYTAEINGFSVTNTHVTETTSVEGSKTWNDNNDQDGIRPDSITIRLLADGVEVASKTVTEADGWDWSFENLPVNNAGKKIAYAVTEDAVAGYETTVNGFDVVNTHDAETVAISGSKTWNDEEDADGLRPDSITIRLLADGVEVASKTVTEADGWAWSFEGMPVYANGTAIVYTITEDAVEGYTATIDGYNVTNTHEVEEEDEEEVPKTGDARSDMQGNVLYAAAALMLIGLVSVISVKKRENR